MVYFGSADHNVYPVSTFEAGKLKWTFVTAGERPFNAPEIHGILPRAESMPDPFDVFLSSPAVADGTVYIGSGDHHACALDPGSGELKWKFATGNVVHASPAVEGHVVYVPSIGKSALKDGITINKKGWTIASPAVHKASCISRRQVAPASTRRHAGIGHRIFSPENQAAPYPNITLDGVIIGLDRMYSLGSILSSPAVAQGVLYVRSTDGTLYALN